MNSTVDIDNIITSVKNSGLIKDGYRFEGVQIVIDDISIIKTLYFDNTRGKIKRYSLQGEALIFAGNEEVVDGKVIRYDDNNNHIFTYEFFERDNEKEHITRSDGVIYYYQKFFPIDMNYVPKNIKPEEILLWGNKGHKISIYVLARFFYPDWYEIEESFREGGFRL